MHPRWVCLLHSVTVKSCWFLFHSTGYSSLSCTLGGSTCCIQLQLKVVDFCFTVRATAPLDAPLVGLLVAFSYSEQLLIFVLQYVLETLEMHPQWVCLLHSVTVNSCWFLFYSTGWRPLRCILGGSACCIQLQLLIFVYNTGYRPLSCTLGGSACCIQFDLKVVDYCFTVRARGPWDVPLWVCWCIQLYLKVVDYCWLLFCSRG